MRIQTTADKIILRYHFIPDESVFGPDTESSIKKKAIEMAIAFWDRVSRDPRISSEFRAYLAINPMDRMATLP